MNLTYVKASALYAGCVLLIPTKKANLKTNFWYLRMKIETVIFLFQTKDHYFDLAVNYWRTQPSIYEGNLGKTVNIELGQVWTEQNRNAINCYEDVNAFHECISKSMSLATETSCWFPTLPLVPEENTLCRTAQEVTDATAAFGNVLEESSVVCNLPCTEISLSVS